MTHLRQFASDLYCLSERMVRTDDHPEKMLAKGEIINWWINGFLGVKRTITVTAQ
jgi:hypothetical protein